MDIRMQFLLWMLGVAITIWEYQSWEALWQVCFSDMILACPKHTFGMFVISIQPFSNLFCRSYSGHIITKHLLVTPMWANSI